MNRHYNHIIVDNPNGPPKESATLPFAELIDAPLNVNNVFEDGVCKVEVKDMYLPNYAMRISKGVFAQDALFINTSANGIDLLGSCLFRDGRFTSYARNKIVECYKGTQGFKFDPYNEFRHRISANTPFHLVHFSLDPDHFFQFLPEDEEWSECLREQIYKNTGFLVDRAAPILLAQERALQTILDCPLTGKLGEIMIETAMTQIVLLQLHSIFRAKKSTKESVSKRDHDIIHSVKEYLNKSYLEDHSLGTLARNFGTNTNKLMALFKTTFGKSVFEYIGELRMEYAQQLLREEDAMIVEVARKLGYKNPNHFSSAFKRRFGINPSHVQLRVRSTG